MKKTLTLLLVCLSASLFAQTYTIDKKVFKSKPELLKSQKNLAKAAQISSPAPVSFSALSMNVTFTELTKDTSGNWKAGQLFSLGTAYLWSWGNGKFNPDSSLTIEQKISIGIGFNFGVTVSSNTGQLVGGLPIGGLLFYSSFGLFGGYDVLNSRPMLGLSYNFAGLPIISGATHFSKLPNE